MDTGFGTEVSSLKKRVDALDTPKEAPDAPDVPAATDTNTPEPAEVEGETSPVTEPTGDGTSEA